MRVKENKKAVFAFIIKSFLPFLLPVWHSCPLYWLGDSNEKQHKHTCKNLSLNGEGSRADMRGDMKSEMLLFISKLKNRLKGPLAEA